jgi:hypothetical protein
MDPIGSRKVIMKYPWNPWLFLKVPKQFRFVLALVSYASCGWIGGWILQLDRSVLRRFVLAFLVPGVLFAAASIPAREYELMFVALIVGLLIAGAWSAASVHKSWHWIAAGSLAFGVLPLLSLALYEMCLEWLNLFDFSAFAAPLMGAAISGFLFGGARALWGNPRITATASGDQHDR